MMIHLGGGESSPLPASISTRGCGGFTNRKARGQIYAYTAEFFHFHIPQMCLTPKVEPLPTHPGFLAWTTACVHIKRPPPGPVYSPLVNVPHTLK